MLLHEILKILHKSIEPMGYRIVDCFELIFENIIYDQNQGVDDLAKKLFSGARAFSQDTTRKLCKKEKFDCLCINIQNNYLTIAGNHYGIYNEILKLLSDCIYMRSEDKQKIIAACDYTQTAELAYLIAACIVCGNYNTLQSNSKTAQMGENYSLSIDYMKLGTSIEEMSLKKELWIVSKERYIDSHNKGNRFYALNIIERLLPQGFFTNTYFLSCGKTEDGRVAPINELCRQTNSNIAIIGAGGIGKTTFLQHMMMDSFL